MYCLNRGLQKLQTLINLSISKFMLSYVHAKLVGVVFMIAMHFFWYSLFFAATSEAAVGKWWETGVIYQIYPRSFKDSNNDGIGDLPGITSKLSYLKDLGVSGVWLSPIYPSPMVDFGYDISNFTDVHPDFGTLADFDEMVAVAHQQGLKIIMDFVPNHSSDQHPWFEKSVKREKGFEDYYVWRNPKGTNPDGSPIPPNNWLSLFYGPAWTFNKERGQFYLHQFATAQPDLNYSNAAVANEMKNVIRFWINRGVDGFRIDAIPFLFESPGEEDEPVNPTGPTDPNDYDHLLHFYTRDFQSTYDMVREWRKILDNQSEEDGVDRCIMVEAYASSEMTMKYFGTAEQPIAHFPFNFQFISLNNETTARDLQRLIHEWMDNVPTYGHSNWLTGNHDNHRIGSRVGADLIDVMTILIMTLPGTAVTYYGEEIGMVDNLDISYDLGKDPEGCNNPPEFWYEKSRDFERTPFQWDDTVNAGFNEGATPWLPVHKNYLDLNVAAQEKDPRSHLSIFKKLLQLRKTEVLQNGRLFMQVQNNTLAYLRATSDVNYYIILLNFAYETEIINLNDLLMATPANDPVVYVSSSNCQITEGTSVKSAQVKVPGRCGLVLIP